MAAVEGKADKAGRKGARGHGTSDGRNKRDDKAAKSAARQKVKNNLRRGDF